VKFSLLALLPLVFGCAFDAGHGFATVEAASLEGRFEPGPARRIEGGFLTDLGYAVALEQLTLEVDELGLDSLTTAGAGGTFDPAHPPPGYTLCHGGHCHADDGSLVSYAEVEAEIAGGGGFSRVVTFDSGKTADLLDPESQSLGDGDPSNELAQTTFRRVVVAVERFELRGEVSYDELEPRELHVALAGGLDLDAPFDLVIDEKGLGPIVLDATLVLDGTLLDGVDFAALADDELETTSADGVLGDAVLKALGNAEITVRIEER
jgi:hypothetical protein